MWDSNRKILFWAHISPDKKELLENLLDEFSISQKGIVLVFDSNDYNEYPEGSIWRNQGIHMNVKIGGIEQMSPDPLLDIMHSHKYENIIWISNRVCSGDNLQFLWVVSHELQHYLQDRISYTLSNANAFLLEAYLFDYIEIEEPKVDIDIPYDFDAELAAFKVVRKFYKNSEIETYLRNSDHGITFDRLSDYNLGNPYDITGQTINYLKKYRIHLQEFSKISDISLDISKAIATLENNTASL